MCIVPNPEQPKSMAAAKRLAGCVHRGNWRVLSAGLRLPSNTVNRSYNSSASVELFYNAQAQVAGSPFYERRANQLLWVDSCKKTINFLALSTGKNRTLEMPQTVGAAVPVAKSDKLVALMGRRICLVERDTGSTVKDLATVDILENSGSKLSVGRCDRLGRLWCAVTGPHYHPTESIDSNGALYSYAAVKGILVNHPTGMSILGGVEWDEDYERMFCIDSPSKKIYAFEFDEPWGELSTQEVLVDYTTDSALGYPSGACRDASGNLWVGGYLGGNVSCWDPSSGELLSQLPVPAKRVTACCYGGPNYDWLFIFTSRQDADETELSSYPDSGAIFVVKDTGVRGIPSHKLRVDAVKVCLF